MIMKASIFYFLKSLYVFRRFNIYNLKQYIGFVSKKEYLKFKIKKYNIITHLYEKKFVYLNAADYQALIHIRFNLQFTSPMDKRINSNNSGGFEQTEITYKTNNFLSFLKLILKNL